MRASASVVRSSIGSERFNLRWFRVDDVIRS